MKPHDDVASVLADQGGLEVRQVAEIVQHRARIVRVNVDVDVGA